MGRLFKPETFQGSLKKKKYFEGWYFKIQDPDRNITLAVIPGISLGRDAHSFIQIISSRGHATAYIRFGVEDFRVRKGVFDLSLGKNRFRPEALSLDIDRDGQRIRGEFAFRHLTPYPVSLFSPGIMGPYRYAPFMECYHGLVSADHQAEGSLSWNGDRYEISKGRGYIEKDWGRSMPSSWIWIQSNLFDQPGTSFMLSIARIPWLGRSFTGHLGFLYHRGQYYRFAIYTGSRCRIIRQDPEQREILLQDKRYALTVTLGSSEQGGPLQAPLEGEMARVIRERVDVSLCLCLKTLRGETVFQGTGRHAGLEVTGDMSELMP